LPRGEWKIGKPKPPAAPDPVALANAQSTANTATAREQQRLNMIGSQGPQGTVRYEADPSSPGGYRQVTSLSPAEQQAYDQERNVYNRSLQTAGDQIGRVSDALGQPLNTQGLPELAGFDGNQRYEDAAYRMATRRLDPQFQRAESSLDAKLAAQGLSENSEATRNLRQDFARDRNDAYGLARDQSLAQGIAGGTFGNQARTQGLQERAYVQNQPLNQLSALLGMGQVGMPTGVQYTPTSVGQTDVLGANALSLNQQNQNYQAKQAASSGLMGGLFSLGTAAMGLPGVGSLFSGASALNKKF
jgi:hypothetical protein